MVDSDFSLRRERIVRELLEYQPVPSERIQRQRWMQCGRRVLVLAAVCGALVALCLASPTYSADVSIGVLIAVFVLGSIVLAGATWERLERDLAPIPPLHFDEVMRLCRSNVAVGQAVERWRTTLGELRAIEGRKLCAASDRLTILGVEQQLAGDSASDAVRSSY